MLLLVGIPAAVTCIQRIVADIELSFYWEAFYIEHLLSVFTQSLDYLVTPRLESRNSPPIAHGCPPRAKRRDPDLKYTGSTSCKRAGKDSGLRCRLGVPRARNGQVGNSRVLFILRWSHFTCMSVRNASALPETCTTGRITGRTGDF
jgi:hypothetical protein